MQRIGRKMLSNGKTVAQQRMSNELKVLPVQKLVGDMDAEEFAAFAQSNPNHPMVKIRIKKENI